jgi:hypothetical protein
VETVRLILQGRGCLRLTHNAIFFSWMHSHDQLDAAAFNRCIHCLALAGIQATSGSSRLIAASAALARGTSVGDVLRLGDWSNASTYFRFFTPYRGIVGRPEFLVKCGSEIDAILSGFDITDTDRGCLSVGSRIICFSFSSP